jgi:hypothetical protein
MKKKPTISVGIVISLILLLINFCYAIKELILQWDYLDFSSFHTWMIYFYINLIVVPLFIALLFFLFYSFFYKWAEKWLWNIGLLLVIALIVYWFHGATLVF